ncbi:hypothetical protein BDZ89DRAFT_177496 [Hymenopellis radicata]|nr:hypothetical protein BDZ89DRAFT_177496 [Hymenopellis radicata]
MILNFKAAGGAYGWRVFIVVNRLARRGGPVRSRHAMDLYFGECRRRLDFSSVRTTTALLATTSSCGLEHRIRTPPSVGASVPTNPLPTELIILIFQYACDDNVFLTTIWDRKHTNTLLLEGFHSALFHLEPEATIIMQFNVFVLLASASLAMSAQINGFAGADCTGSLVFSSGASSNECLTLGGASVKSIGYSGVPSQIQFFESGGQHDSCTNGAQSVLGGGSGCSNAPVGFNWESVAVF